MVPERNTAFETARAEAVDTLRVAYGANRIPEDASVESLAASLKATPTDDPFREDAARILAMLAEEFPERLASIAPEIAETLDGTGRSTLLRTLGYVSEVDPTAVVNSTGTLVTALGDDDSAVVREAVWTLSNVAEAEPAVLEEAFPHLVDLLSHEDGEVRRRAVGVIADASRSDLADHPGVLDRLLEELESTHHYRTAGRALVEVVPTYEDRLVDALFARLETGTPSIREHVGWTLALLASEHPDRLESRRSALLELVASDDDHQVKNGAAAALAGLATADPDATLLASITSLLEEDDEFTRRYGCLALGDVAVTAGHSEALATLADARSDGAPLVEREAERLLAEAAGENPEAVAAVAPEIVEELDIDDDR